MLSRVAESLYWMSRYVERAESIARMVDVNLQLMLDIPSRQARELMKNWFPIVASLGEETVFRRRVSKTDAAAVTEFLVFDRDHGNSLAGCLSAARENARTVREHLTTDMWEQINRTYLWFMSKSARQSFERNQYDFFQRVKKTLQLFQGITDTTMFQGEGWEFMQIGKHLERADKTSRLLDEKYHILHRKDATPNDLLLQWLAVLRSCSARQIYQRVYASSVEPVKVAELLLLNENMPRSVVFCVSHLDQCLRRISGVLPGRFSNLAEKLSGRLLAELSYSSIDDLYSQGLHHVMDDLQIKLNHIGEAVYQTYIYRNIPVVPLAATLPQPAQE
jgi:uncharacterized alpha-E superfamily protein